MNLITFSTLACPAWSLETVITRAAEFGYDGVEWRGGSQGHVQPTMPASQRALLQQMSSDHGLAVLAVTAYTSFVSSMLEELRANIDEACQYVDLAAELGAKYVRVFLGELPAETKLDAALYESISDSLFTISDYAASLGVTIAIEPHDNFARSSTIFPLFNSISFHPNTQVIWDIGNTFAAGETPSESFEPLKDHLAYVQVKDGKGRAPNWQLCSLGEGDIPLAEAFELLLTNGYQGAVSVEWEYTWHPELDPPEIALPSALRTVRKLLSTTQRESA